MLAMVLNPPQSPQDWDRWSFANADAVSQINQAILAQKKINLGNVQLWPIPADDIGSWLQDNQDAHNAFNSTLGLSGSDLLHVELSDFNQLQTWIWLNFSELLAACQSLKIGP